MDLLEIRKKAKGMKGAQEDASSGAPKDAQSEKNEEAGAKAESSPDAFKKKKSGRKKSASKKAVAQTTVAVEEPAAVQEAGPGVCEEPAGRAAVSAATEPVASPNETWKPEPAPSCGVEAVSDGERPEQAEGSEEEIEYLSFMLADEEYAIRVAEIKEIIRPQKTTGVPRTPGFVVGIISLRGIILPVMDIKMRLGLQNSGRTKTTRIVIVSDGGSPLGILVDRVTGVVRLKKTEIEPPPAVIGGVESEYLNGVGRRGDRLLILFNTQKVLEMEGH